MQKSIENSATYPMWDTVGKFLQYKVTFRFDVTVWMWWTHARNFGKQISESFC